MAISSLCPLSNGMVQSPTLSVQKGSPEALDHADPQTGMILHFCCPSRNPTTELLGHGGGRSKKRVQGDGDERSDLQSPYPSHEFLSE